MEKVSTDHSKPITALIKSISRTIARILRLLVNLPSRLLANIITSRPSAIIIWLVVNLPRI